MVDVFREVKRVLRDDGTLFLNLGDSFMPDKNLVGIPWMVAFALRADGWYLRSDIIWAKPNPMPESVTDRPTKSHEYIFLMSKSQKYFYDAEAVKEPSVDPASYVPRTARNPDKRLGDKFFQTKVGDHANGKIYASRNRRSVWTVSTQPYPEAHFATFPPKLIEPCILAGSSHKSCEVCGAPWERVVERAEGDDQGWAQDNNPTQKEETLVATGKRCGHGKLNRGSKDDYYNNAARKITTGYQPTCTCEQNGSGKSIVLDPFAGSGTTLLVAEQHGREGWGIELNPEYVKLIEKRLNNRQVSLLEMGVV